MNTIDITALTPEQLKAVRAQLKAVAKASRDTVGDRYAVIDPMLKAVDGQFIHTTSDILTALQDKGLVPKDLGKEDRAEWLKKVQTRKQYLEHLTNKDGTLVHDKGSLGYKSSGGFMALTADRVMDYVIEHAESFSAADRKAIIKALTIKN